MRLASIGPAGSERPVIVSDDGGRYLNVDLPSWKVALERGEAQSLLDGAGRPGPDWRPMSGERLGPPIPDPGKIVAIGLNYRDHAEEQGKEPPEEPLLFAKAPTCLIGHGDSIVVPAHEGRPDAEAELAIVIGRAAKGVTSDEAPAAVFGFTIFNDVSGRQAQYGDKQWFRGKSYDTFGPCGPWIVPARELGDPHTLAIRSTWNGRLMQDSNTSKLIHGVYDLVAYVSAQMTLLPGDLIATGTPSGVGVFREPPVFLASGDVVRIEIERIGFLENPVVVEKPFR